MSAPRNNLGNMMRRYEAASGTDESSASSAREAGKASAGLLMRGRAYREVLTT